MPKINTFLQRTSQPIVEPISKIFIATGVILGVNRLPLITTTKIVWIVLCYSTCLNLLFFYTTMQFFPIPYRAWACMLITDHIQFLFCTVLAFVLLKRLRNFYGNLNNFDTDIGMKVTKFGIQESIYNFLQFFLTIIECFALYFLSANDWINYAYYLPHLMPMKFINCFEVHYYGHLFSLLIPRLQAIKNCMTNSYPNKIKISETQPDRELQSEDKNSRVDMKRLMDFYNNIIIVHDSLNEAVKWQMLALLISTFSISLCLLYHIVKTAIWGKAEKYGVIVVSIAELSMQLLPFLVPCVFANRVQKEVRLIRDFLARKLYENTLDKPTRSTARILLGLIETRNLSFSMFHMFDIDISLPFKLIALLITYVIILLQVDKVISNESSFL